MNTQSTAKAATTTIRPACQRCSRRDHYGLANVRGLRLCGVCVLIAKARAYK